jgi:hypothetical protein
MRNRRFCYAVGGLFLALFVGAASAAGIVNIAPCGSDPIVNTNAIQEKINDDGNNSILILPPGKCVLAKCSIANPGADNCRGEKGAHASALYIGRKHNLTLRGASNGTSELVLDPRTTLLASVMTTGMMIGYFAVFFWLPTFLKTERGLSVMGSGQYTMIVIVGSFIGYLAAAYAADHLAGARHSLFSR